MGGSAGDDEINTGAGSDRISGEATAEGEGAEAKVLNDAHSINSSGASAGNDVIDAGVLEDTVSGGALASGVNALASVLTQALAAIGLRRAGHDATAPGTPARRRGGQSCGGTGRTR